MSKHFKQFIDALCVSKIGIDWFEVRFLPKHNILNWSLYCGFYEPVKNIQKNSCDFSEALIYFCLMVEAFYFILFYFFYELTFSPQMPLVERLLHVSCVLQHTSTTEYFSMHHAC